MKVYIIVREDLIEGEAYLHETYIEKVFSDEEKAKECAQKLQSEHSYIRLDGKNETSHYVIPKDVE